MKSVIFHGCFSPVLFVLLTLPVYVSATTTTFEFSGNVTHSSGIFANGDYSIGNVFT